VPSDDPLFLSGQQFQDYQYERRVYDGLTPGCHHHESGSGQVFELQFHTRASLEAKELTHPAYERIRNSETSDDERAELEDFQRRIGGKIPIPPGAAEIEDYPREERDG
jgi:hypothetical protein